MSNGNIYDPTAQVGTAIAERKYKKTQADIERRKEWAKTGRDSALGLAVAGSKYQREALNVEMFGEMVPGLPETSMFKLKKTGSLLERVKRDVWRTKEAYELGPSGESFIAGVKAGRPAEIDKLKGMGVEPKEYLEKIEGMMKKQPLFKPIKPGVGDIKTTAGKDKFIKTMAGMDKSGRMFNFRGNPKPTWESKIPLVESGKPKTQLFGKGFEKGMAGLQVGTGLYSLANPKSSTAQQFGGAAQVALGVNAGLQAFGMANAWNPAGWGSLAASFGASLFQSGAFG